MLQLPADQKLQFLCTLFPEFPGISRTSSLDALLRIFTCILAPGGLRPPDLPGTRGISQECIQRTRSGFRNLSTKKVTFVFFVSLASPNGFISAIFGIFGKFWIDIGVQKNFGIFFRDEKILRKTNNLGTFEII